MADMDIRWSYGEVVIQESVVNPRWSYGEIYRYFKIEEEPPPVVANILRLLRRRT
jgi:hypothetical protein